MAHPSSRAFALACYLELCRLAGARPMDSELVLLACPGLFRPIFTRNL